MQLSCRFGLCHEQAWGARSAGRGLEACRSTQRLFPFRFARVVVAMPDSLAHWSGHTLCGLTCLTAVRKPC